MRSATRPHLASLVADWLRRPREVAVVLHRGNRALPKTYGDLADLAGRCAAAFERQGLVAGDRLVLWGENSAEWVAAFFGCVLRGIIAVPLDAAGSPAFTERVIGEVAPKLLVGDPALLGTLHSAVPRVELAGMAERLSGPPLLAIDPAVRLDAPVQIVFTSGTTAEPKGVVHTHRNILASVAPIEREMARYLRYERPFHPLRFLHTLPLSHVFGQFMGLWLPPLLGAEVHFSASLEPARVLGLLRRQRISVLVAVPRVLDVLRAHLRERFPGLETQLAASAGIPAWKRWWRFRAVHRLLGWKFWALICGGATLPAELEAFWNGLGLALVQGYGMTETAALVTLNHPFRVGKGTLGKALPGREVRLGPGGEIEVRGDMLAAGTWRGGEFQPRTEEWLRTGDLGSQEATGELRFAGRKGDVLVTAAGLNVYPSDLEAALLADEEVRACAVVGCASPRGTEPVAAVVWAAGEREPDLQALRDRANAQLAPHQQIRRVLRWPAPQLPYTATGKLLRRDVAAWACAALAAQDSQAGQPAADGDALVAALAEITHQPIPDGNDAQRLTEDLYLDSLGRVQLQSVLAERFGVEVEDTAMAAAQTVGDLRRLLGGSHAGRPGLADSPAAMEVTAISPMRGQAGSTGLRPLPYPHWPWSGPVQGLRTLFLACVARPLVRWLAAPRVRQVAPLPHGPLLLIANHVNTFDVPLVLYALPGPLRPRVAVAMSAEVLGALRAGVGQGHPLLNLLARPAYWLLVALFNVFPLPRLEGFRRSFAHAGEALDRGYSVLVFPEGRRSFSGALQPFRPGVGLLVQASGVPVVPVALRGVGSAARPGRRWFRTGQVEIVLGDPLRFEPGDTPEAITQRLEATLRALSPS